MSWSFNVFVQRLCQTDFVEIERKNTDRERYQLSQSRHETHLAYLDMYLNTCLYLYQRKFGFRHSVTEINYYGNNKICQYMPGWSGIRIEDKDR